MNELLTQLADAYGPSGFEDGVRDIIRPIVEPLVDEISVDALGNLIARRQGSADGRRVMVAAHMDEIGLMVTHITEEGFLRFTNIGGVSAHNLRGARVQFADGLIGVIGSDRLQSRTALPALEKYYIDVGAGSRDDCPVSVGAAAGFLRPAMVQGQRVTAKALDDRVGCYILIETLRRLQATPHDIYAVFSVQEEIGTRGAAAAANLLLPDVALALDVTLTGDTPKARSMPVSLGQGPAIKVKDSGMIAHAGIVRLMRQRADEAGLPYQLEVLDGGTTDARSMQIAGPGAAAGCISIPCRYVHTQSETVDLRDVEQSVDLLTAILMQPIDL